MNATRKAARKVRKAAAREIAGTAGGGTEVRSTMGTKAPTRAKRRPSGIPVETPVVLPGADGHPAFAVLPWPEYEALRQAAAKTGIEAAEDAADAARAAAIGERIAAGAEEVFPAAVLDRLDAGDNPIRVFRDLRGLTQQALAAAAGVNQGYLSELETGAKSASVKTLRALARALRIDVDLLMPAEAAA